MALRIRTTRSQEELASALGSIGHYFGGAWMGEDAERFGRLLPVERMHAAFDGAEIVGGAARVRGGGSSRGRGVLPAPRRCRHAVCRRQGPS